MTKRMAGIRGLAAVLALAATAGTTVRADNMTVTNQVTMTNYVTVMVTNVVTLTNVIPVVVAPAPAAAEPAKPKSTWTVTASAGLTLTKGNSDTALFTAKVLADQKTDKYELSLDADGGYGETSGTENVNFYHGYAQYNQLFTPRFYAYGRLEGLHDQIAAVDYRITLAPGLGYYFIKTARVSLSGEFGPGYVFDQEGGNDKCYASLRVADKFEYKLNDHLRIWENWEFLPDVEDFNKYVTDGEIGVEAAMTKKSNLQVYLDDTYDSQPAAGRKNNDVKLVSAFAYKF